MGIMGFFKRWRFSREMKTTDLSPELQSFIDTRIRAANKDLLSRVSTVIRDSADEIGSPDTKADQIERLIQSINDNVKVNAVLVSEFKKNVDDRIDENADRVEALIDAVSERSKKGEDLDDCFSKDVCPFDKKFGKCKIWMNRPVKSDAPNYCAPCRLQRMLTERGVR